MRSTLAPEHMTDLLTALDSRFVVRFADGAIRVLGRSLPDETVCAILPSQPDNVLRVVYDPNKANAMCHVRTMLQEWWESFAEPVVFPDGTVELLRTPSPRAGEGNVELESST